MTTNTESTKSNQQIDWDILPDVTHLLEDATDPA